MPVSYTVPSHSAPVPRLSDRQRLFGRDIYFRGDTELTGAGDYVLAEDVRNLRLSIYRRLYTDPGTYALRPDYGAGLSAAVKSPANVSELRQIENRIRQQLRQEDRIQSIEEVVVQQTELGGTPVLRVYVKVRAFGHRLEFRPFDFSRDRTFIGVQ